MRWGAFIASGEAVAVARIARVAADFMFGYSLRLVFSWGYMSEVSTFRRAC